MLTPYSFDDYKEFLRAVISARKKANPDWGSGRFADEIGIQRSYLSRVLHGPADFSSDQLYLASELLGLGAGERRYLLLCLEIARTGVAARKKELLAERGRLQKLNLRSEKYLKSNLAKPEELPYPEYYANPLCPLVHMLLTMPAYARDPRQIPARLNVSPEALAPVYSVLERCQLIRPTKKGYEVISKALHIEARSYLSRLYATQFRLKAIERQQGPQDEADYFFTASFTADEKVRRKLKERLLETLKWLSSEVEQGEPKELFHVNFDLFKP
jgi:hypothetical protein